MGILILLVIGLAIVLFEYLPRFPKPEPEPDRIEHLYNSFPESARDMTLEKFRREFAGVCAPLQSHEGLQMMLDRQLHYRNVGLGKETMDDVEEKIKREYSTS